MSHTRPALFTIGVFQDVAWADKGLAAFRAHGFTPDEISVVALDTPDAASLVERSFGHAGVVRTSRVMGTLRVRGPLVETLDGADAGLDAQGLTALAGRLGFQAHDGHIFEALVARGGFLVAVTSDARAADALALLHAYGGGNAAIGAWVGRV